MIDFLLERMAESPGREALVWRGRGSTHSALLERAEAWRIRLRRDLPAPGVIGLLGDFSPDSVACLLALVEAGQVVVPVYRKTAADLARLGEIAEVEAMVEVTQDGATIRRSGRRAGHPLYRRLREQGHAGLVLFSSGTSGQPKAALHDLKPLLEKFQRRREALRTLSFLLFDHIGGLNTLLHTLSNAGTLVTVEDRSPDAVCEAIERHSVQLLPTSPSFLNLLLLSGAHRSHDLSTLRLVTYGTEPMPAITLERLRRELPGIELRQTYGLAEVGILRTKSRPDGSLWMRIGGEGYQTRVVDGLLEIKASSAMLGYLNAPSPFTEDGWLRTGDSVLVDGDWIRVLGRASEIINVGGRKVAPAEVEGVIEELAEVALATVWGESHPLVGSVVRARVNLSPGAEAAGAAIRVRRHCAQRMDGYKVPVKVEVVDQSLVGERFKKARTPGRQ